VKSNEFNIVFKGIEYIVEITEWKGKKSIYVEYAKIDEDVSESDLLNFTQYLIEEGFVEYKNLE
jgi:hypothetical protein